MTNTQLIVVIPSTPMTIDKDDDDDDDDIDDDDIDDDVSFSFCSLLRKTTILDGIGSGSGAFGISS